ncbi:hypothetical protein ACFS25_04235 [Spirosoma flavum]|uniref:Uncharacterized protein n=1 Tax=Spirosoma flavum TaxID=2048557 RepID=A0ABW6AFS3_9BACT
MCHIRFVMTMLNHFFADTSLYNFSTVDGRVKTLDQWDGKQVSMN